MAGLSLTTKTRLACDIAKEEIWDRRDVPTFSPPSRLPHLEDRPDLITPSSKLNQEMFVAMQRELSIDPDTDQSGENSVVPPGLDCFSHLPQR